MSNKKHWVQDIHMKKGALHKALHVSEDKKIPALKLEKAKHSRSPTIRREAHLAETFKKMHKSK